MPAIPSVCQPLDDHIAQLEADKVPLYIALDEAEPRGVAWNRIRRQIAAIDGVIAHLRAELSDCIQANQNPPPEVKMCIDKPATGGVLPPRKELTTYSIESDGSITVSVRQGLGAVTAKMWDTGQTVRVKMMGGTSFIRSKVRHYADVWTQHANIHFAFVDPDRGAEIKIAFDPGRSNSNIGRDALSVPFNFATMNFGWFTDNTAEQEFRRVVLHEFGHALGFIHEHQSPVGGIQWNRERVYAFYWEQEGWDRGMVDANVFEKYSFSTTNYSQYDPTSIMHYPIDASLTLDGVGQPRNSDLSETDREWARRFYPYAPTPNNANGLLRTGDDCDEIDFVVEYGVVVGNYVEFRLNAASGLTWWKAIEVPVGGGYQMLEIQDGGSAAQTIPLSLLDTSRPIRFNKAKLFGAHTRLSYTWDVIWALPAGARISFLWKRDRC